MLTPKGVKLYRYNGSLPDLAVAATHNSKLPCQRQEGSSSRRRGEEKPRDGVEIRRYVARDHQRKGLFHMIS